MSEHEHAHFAEEMYDWVSIVERVAHDHPCVDARGKNVLRCVSYFKIVARESDYEECDHGAVLRFLLWKHGQTEFPFGPGTGVRRATARAEAEEVKAVILSTVEETEKLLPETEPVRQAPWMLNRQKVVDDDLN